MDSTEMAVSAVLDVAGKIVVLHGSSEPLIPNALSNLVSQLRDAGAQLVIVCGPDHDLRALDETEMAGAGWVSARRGGTVEGWLQARRDALPSGDSKAWWAVDHLLEELRRYDDLGLPLGARLPDL